MQIWNVNIAYTKEWETYKAFISTLAHNSMARNNKEYSTFMKCMQGVTSDFVSSSHLPKNLKHYLNIGVLCDLYNII